MGNKMKAKGTAFESLVVRYLRDRSFKRCYRPAVKGSADTGDINGIAGSRRQAIIQCKNQRKFDLSGWLNDAVSQAQQEEVGGERFTNLGSQAPRSRGKVPWRDLCDSSSRRPK